MFGETAEADRKLTQPDVAFSFPDKRYLLRGVDENSSRRSRKGEKFGIRWYDLLPLFDGIKVDAKTHVGKFQQVTREN